MDTFSRTFHAASRRTTALRLASTAGLNEHASREFIDCEQLEQRAMLAVTPLVTPFNLSTQLQSDSAVRVAWKSPGREAAAFAVFRSDNGAPFTRVARVGPAARAFVDADLEPSHAYRYKVRAIRGSEATPLSMYSRVVTPMGTPTDLVTTLDGSSEIDLSWSARDLTATGYSVFRSTDGGSTFSLIASVQGGSTTSFSDTSISGPGVYTYSVQAVNGSRTSRKSSHSSTSVQIVGPSNFSASASGRTVNLSWVNSAGTQSLIVMRSGDGVSFTDLATLAPSATSYADSSVVTGSGYVYKLRAISGESQAYSSVSSLTVPLIAPTIRVPQNISTSIQVNWTDENNSAVSFQVLRAIGSGSYSVIGSAASGATSFLDSSVAAGTNYKYKVRAVLSDLASGDSGAASINTPSSLPGTPAQAGLTVTTRFGNELVINAGTASDTINISMAGGSVNIVANGYSFSYTGTYVGLFLYDRGGSDQITIDSSVSVRTFITTLGSSVSTITSGISNLFAWVDTNDVFTGSGNANRVGALVGNVSKAVGQSLPNPTDAGTVTTFSRSLFGAGPNERDINQGSVGDCYFLASIAGFAHSDPNALLKSAIDLGDGTYLVKYKQSGVDNYFRVNNQFSSGGFGGWKYAHPGSNNTIWGAVFEKAFAHARTGANTYNSINSGWMSTVYTLFGISSSSVSLSGTTETALYNTLSSALAAGKTVTFGTYTSNCTLVCSHAYTLVDAFVDSGGVARFKVRNPWGVSGTSAEDSQGYATLTFAQMQQNFTLGVKAA